jgi:hypothetical protein
MVQNLINAAQKCAPESRETMREKFVESVAFVDAADVHITAVFGRHKLDGSRCPARFAE